MSVARDLDFLPGFAFEGFPNRDSTKYAKLYGIEDAHTIFRGTLRYKGFAECMTALQLFGLVDPNPHPSLHPEGPEITWVCNKQMEHKTTSNILEIHFVCLR